MQDDIMNMDTRFHEISPPHVGQLGTCAEDP